MNTHDFRKQFWGNALHDPKMKGKKIVASCHTPLSMRKGDDVMWRTAFGYCVAQVLKVDGCLDPMDMYYFTAKIKRRVVTIEVTAEQRRKMHGFEFAA